MKFDDTILNKTELKMLKCLKYRHANMWEFHGYFNFPSMEHILLSLNTLENNNLIYKEAVTDIEDYYLSEDGKKYLQYIISKKHSCFWKRIGAIIAALGSLVVIVEFVWPALTNSLP